MAKGYVIQVGHYNPQEAIVAYPDDRGRPKEDTIIKVQKTIGKVLIMNRARVYARRVDENLKMVQEAGKDIVLEVTDKRYRGFLEFLDWGSDKLGAQAIDVMFLTNSQSLDYEYQRTIQKLEPRNEDIQIELAPGENKFDYKTEALKIQLFKVHPQNRDSKSKNQDPSIKGFTYYEVTDEQTDKSYTKAKEASITAGAFVKEISTKPVQMRNLFEIFKGYGVEFGSVNHLSNDTEIYSALLKLTDQPGDFGANVNRYKQDLLDKFDLAKSYKALDLTKDGFIALTVDQKAVIAFEGAKGKGEKMIDWVLDNFLDDYVYSQSQYFKSLCAKLK